MDRRRRVGDGHVDGAPFMVPLPCSWHNAFLNVPICTLLEGSERLYGSSSPGSGCLLSPNKSKASSSIVLLCLCLSFASVSCPCPCTPCSLQGKFAPT
jgi:hypothetical protein